ncbi:MAG: hypothetical protein WAM30_02875, partial [Candidatus Dormiibacterota bacterium]
MSIEPRQPVTLTTAPTDPVSGDTAMTVPPFEPAPTAQTLPEPPATTRRTMTLSVVGGLANLRLWTETGLAEPFQAHFEGPQPEVSQQGDEVTITYHGGPFNWGRTAADIQLRPDVSWAIRVRGGVSRGELELGGADVRAIELTGGASRLEIRLGEASGTVPVRIRGGVSRATIERPASVPVRVEVGGGASRLAVDTQEFGGIGGPARLESGPYESAPNRYHVEVGGGASRL